jgi:hypothetical protein
MAGDREIAFVSGLWWLVDYFSFDGGGGRYCCRSLSDYCFYAGCRIRVG